MKYKAHLLGGISVFFIFLSILKSLGFTFPIYMLLIFLFSSLSGALICDIDARRSKVRRAVLFILSLIGISIIINSIYVQEIFYGIGILALGFVLKKFSKHRKFFHSFKFGILSSIALGLVSEFYLSTFIPAFFFFLGFFSHLVLDKMV